MPWTQRQVQLPPLSRGWHLVTAELVSALHELAETERGVLHVFVQHTSASLSINENADPDVPTDLEASINAIAPEDFPYRHTLEGPDDMPAHVENSLLGVLALDSGGRWPGGPGHLAGDLPGRASQPGWWPEGGADTPWGVMFCEIRYPRPSGNSIHDERSHHASYP